MLDVNFAVDFLVLTKFFKCGANIKIVSKMIKAYEFVWMHVFVCVIMNIVVL